MALVAVYRARHAERMRRLIEDLGPSVSVRLWCLDNPSEALLPYTIGAGPGVRFALLNRLIDTVPQRDRRGGLVLSDDDYSFRVGTLRQLVTAGRALDLDVWQPAHDRSSWIDLAFLRRRTGVVMRRTTFVEQGPVLVLSARAQEVMLPLPEDLGMGWGVEVRWSQLPGFTSLRLGILDAVAIHHERPGGGSYDRSEQHRQLRRMLDDAGMSSIRDLQQEHSRIGPREGRRLLRP